MIDKIVYKTISKEEYERLKAMSWETAQGELFKEVYTGIGGDVEIINNMFIR